MKKIILSAGLILASFGAANAQGLQVGANLGATMGVSLKYGSGEGHAFEGVFGYVLPEDGIAIKAMYNYHIPLVDALSLYMGGGLSIGGYQLDEDYKSKHKFAFGIVPAIGLEYQIKSAPVNLAFGYEPVINFTKVDHVINDVALKVRYRF